MKESLLTKSQFKKITKQITYDGLPANFTVTLRFDDRWCNGYNFFCITGNIYSKRCRLLCGGCVHDEIREYFPELEADSGPEVCGGIRCSSRIDSHKGAEP